MVVLQNNVADIKASHSYHGAYSLLRDKADDKYKIEPWMPNLSILPTKSFGSYARLIRYNIIMLALSYV